MKVLWYLKPKNFANWTRPKALFRFKKFLDFDTIAFSFLFE